MVCSSFLLLMGVLWAVARCSLLRVCCCVNVPSDGHVRSWFLGTWEENCWVFRQMHVESCKKPLECFPSGLGTLHTTTFSSWGTPSPALVAGRLDGSGLSGVLSFFTVAVNCISLMVAMCSSIPWARSTSSCLVCSSLLHI